MRTKTAQLGEHRTLYREYKGGTEMNGGRGKYNDCQRRNKGCRVGDNGMAISGRGDLGLGTWAACCIERRGLGEGFGACRYRSRGVGRCRCRSFGVGNSRVFPTYPLCQSRAWRDDTADMWDVVGARDRIVHSCRETSDLVSFGPCGGRVCSIEVL